MTKEEALQMCLEYIETNAHERKYVRHAIKKALAADVREPVAWRWVNPKGWLTYGEAPHDTFKSTPLYTTPPAQPVIPDALTSADIEEHIEYVAGWNDCRQAMLEMMK